MGRQEDEEEVWNKQLNNEVFQFILFFNNNTLETLSCDSKHILLAHSSAFFLFNVTPASRQIFYEKCFWYLAFGNSPNFLSNQKDVDIREYIFCAVVVFLHFLSSSSKFFKKSFDDCKIGKSLFIHLRGRNQRN